MKKVTSFLFVVFLLTVAAPLFAQADNNYEVNPCGGLTGDALEECEFGDSGSSGTGSSNPDACWVCTAKYNDTTGAVYCSGWPLYGGPWTPLSVYASGNTVCTAINTGQNPHYCLMSGTSCTGHRDFSAPAYHMTPEARVFDDLQPLVEFLVKSKAMTKEDLANWMGDVEDRLLTMNAEDAATTRVRMYREKVALIIHRPLKDGQYPVAPIPLPHVALIATPRKS